MSSAPLFEFADLTTARVRPGVRLVVMDGQHSLWSEAVKALFVVKGIPATWVRFSSRDDELAHWTRTHNAPVAFFDDEPPRSQTSDIVTRAERCGGRPLLSDEPEERARQFGFLHEVAGEEGLGWSLRALAIGASLASEGSVSFSLPVGQYLARKYGVAAARLPSLEASVLAQLRRWADKLERGAREQPFFFGARLSAVDIFVAAGTLLLTPPRYALWGDQQNPDTESLVVREMKRAARFLADEYGPRVPPALIAHRDHLFQRVVREAIDVGVIGHPG